MNTAQAVGAAFGYTFAAWLDDASEGLGVHLERAFVYLRTLSAGGTVDEPPSSVSTHSLMSSKRKAK